MHPSDGTLRSYVDRQLASSEMQRAEAHLRDCAACRNRAQSLQDGAGQTYARLERLHQAPERLLKPSAARRLLAERLQKPMEATPMFERLTRRISRPTWAAIAIIAVLALSMAFPSVRAAAGNLLQMFRVEQVRIIPVDMRSLPGDLDSSEQLQAMFTDHVEIEERGEHRTVADADEAAALAGFNLRLPADLTGDTAIVYQPGGVATFTLDLELARGVLREMGRTDIELPDTLDGAKARIDIPDSVAINRGDCRQPSKDEATEFDSSQKAEPRDCLTLLQMPSPSISAPPNLNLEELGKIYLQVLGLNDKEAELFARTVDWTTTFVIPVPVGSASYEEVQVDGVAGTLISERSRQRTTVLLWVKDGTIYVLEGANSKAEALRIANSLQ